MQLERIALLGLGVMGGPMAVHLKSAGFEVTVWNRTPSRPRVDQARQAGCAVAGSIAEAVAEAEVVAICVSDVPDVKEVLFDAGGVTEAARPGTVVIDFSTIGPQAARECAAELAGRQIAFLDAPVSGGDIGARNGTLTVMVGGEKADFKRMMPVFEAVGKNIHYCGEVGAGQAVKMCNQIRCAVHMTALCESLHYAERCGIDPQLVIDVCQSGAAGSWDLVNLGPRILNNDLASGFGMDLMLKDLRLVAEAGVDLPGTRLAQELFNRSRHNNPASTVGTQGMIDAYRG